MNPLRKILPALMALVLFTCSCERNRESVTDSSEVLVSVRDSSLLVSDVVSQIPSGLEAVDSIELFRQIVDNWIRDLVLAEYAEKNLPDIAKIDKMVDEYRNNLIINRYLQIASESSKQDYSEEELKKYFNSHHKEMILDQPLVKGALLIVSDNDESVENLRIWMSQFTDTSIDKIEKSGLRQASRYELFKDEWYEWSAVADLIPHRFGDADSFLRNYKDFEVQSGNVICLLHISEYIPSGHEMPFEFAKFKIRDILKNSEMVAQRDKFIKNIYKERIKSGVLRPGLYNPLKSEMN